MARATIDPAMLEGVRTVIGHGREDAPCTDAMAAAILIRDVMEGVTIRFVPYESKEHAELPAEPGMLFVDISPPAARIDEFLAARTLVLDHHRSARAETKAFEDVGLGVYADAPGVSAATLAYEHIWTVRQDVSDAALSGDESSAGALGRLMGIYDTWQKQHPDRREAEELAAVLYFFPDWLELPSPLIALAGRRELGPLLCRKDRERVRSAVAGAYRFETKTGVKVAVLSSTSAVSEAAEAPELAGADVVVGFMCRVREGGLAIKLSFRSRNGFVVRTIAESLGGGGHDAAASAWIALGDDADGSDPHPYAMIRLVMEKVTRTFAR